MSFNYPKLRLWIVQTRVRSFRFVIQDFLSHGISIPIGSSNKFTKKLVKMLHQNCNCCGLVNAIWLTISHWLMCNGNFITGPYWNVICIFHKTKIQTIILRNWMGLYLNWFYRYGIKHKRKLIKILWLRCLTIWKDEFIWQIKMGYKAFRKCEMN